MINLLLPSVKTHMFIHTDTQYIPQPCFPWWRTSQFQRAVTAWLSQHTLGMVVKRNCVAFRNSRPRMVLVKALEGHTHFSSLCFAFLWAVRRHAAEVFSKQKSSNNHVTFLLTRKLHSPTPHLWMNALWLQFLVELVVLYVSFTCSQM